MANSRAPASAAVKVSHQSLLLGIVALTVVYQIIFHMFAQGRLDVPGVACPGGESVESDGQCAELQLFAQWRENEALLDEATGAETDDPAPEHDPPRSRELPSGTFGNAVQKPTPLVAHGLPSGDTDATQHGSIVASVVATHLTPWLLDAPTHEDVTPVATHEATHLTHLTQLTPVAGAVATHLEARMKGLMSAHQQLASSQENRPLLDQIMSLGREMCQDPLRRKRPTCSQFVEEPAAPEKDGRSRSSGTLAISAPTPPAVQPAPNSANGTRVNHKAELAERIANLEAQRARLAGSMQAWELELVHKIVDVGHDFCAEARRQGFSSCAPFLGGAEANHTAAGNHTEEPTKVPQADFSYDARRKLSWPPVVAGPALRGGSAGPADVSAAELRGAKWNARIPMVACVMAIPATARARAQLRYAVDNFFLQSYEGPRQLILVHHAEDERGLKLARKYADGSYIKALAAHGDALPSTPALRYGAWSSGADIVAHWEIGEWHHPDRLAMQVRALGLTRRPACMLRRVTLADASGGRNPSPDGFAEDSLVGEKGWMAKHWYPSLQGASNGEQQTAMEAKSSWSKERQLAILDAPELLVRHEVSPDAAAPDDEF